MRTRSALAFALAVGTTVPVACLKNETTGPNIPPNAIVYVMSQSTLSQLYYHYVDTATGVKIDHLWLIDHGFVGSNCIGLVPRTPSDTFGQFVFAFNGANVGEIQRIDGITGATDTVVVSFLPAQAQGTHGNYVYDPTSGKLKLFWADGQQTQYFDPTADIRLINDSIKSHAELSALADSIHASWRVTWIRDLCR